MDFKGYKHSESIDTFFITVRRLATYIGFAKYLFWENALKNQLNIFKFLFLFESTILPVNNGK